MTITTTDFEIDPADGWTLVATSPAYVLVAPTHRYPYFVAVAASEPPRSLRGAVFAEGENFEANGVADAGNVYVRVERKPTDRPLRFAVITSDAAVGPTVGDGTSTANFLSGGALGITASANFTPVAEAYGAGDIIDAAKEFAFTFANGQTIPVGSNIRILTSVMKIDATAIISGEASYSLPLYSVTPPSAQSNNNLWTLASADLAAYRGTLPLGTPVDLGAALYIKTPYQDMDIKLTGTSLFGELVTNAAFTAAAVVRQVLLYGVLL